MTNQEMIKQAIESGTVAREKSVKLLAYAKTKEGKEKAALIGLADFVYKQAEINDTLCLMLTNIADYVHSIEDKARVYDAKVKTLEKQVRILSE